MAIREVSASVQKAHIHLTSVFDNFWSLVFRRQLQLFLPLHIAVPSHGAQVTSVHSQQHHRGRKGPIADVGKLLSGQHGKDPVRKQEIRPVSAEEHWKAELKSSHLCGSNNFISGLPI